ncbi:MAG: hypothetical protein D6719_13565 [Candidatus Dadabacteria bacterium]|nr:MAG: hypothetical protein D6719_13565 [Candidatus Dadabacteria bacterium]
MVWSDVHPLFNMDSAYEGNFKIEQFIGFNPGVFMKKAKLRSLRCPVCKGYTREAAGRIANKTCSDTVSTGAQPTPTRKLSDYFYYTRSCPRCGIVFRTSKAVVLVETMLKGSQPPALHKSVVRNFTPSNSSELLNHNLTPAPMAEAKKRLLAQRKAAELEEKAKLSGNEKRQTTLSPAAEQDSSAVLDLRFGNQKSGFYFSLQLGKGLSAKTAGLISSVTGFFRGERRPSPKGRPPASRHYRRPALASNSKS